MRVRHGEILERESADLSLNVEISAWPAGRSAARWERWIDPCPPGQAATLGVHNGSRRLEQTAVTGN